MSSYSFSICTVENLLVLDWHHIEKKMGLPRKQDITVNSVDRRYDYRRCGAHFVTICTQGRACLFGAIDGGRMVMNEAGSMVKGVWDGMIDRFRTLIRDDQVTGKKAKRIPITWRAANKPMHRTPLRGVSDG